MFRYVFNLVLIIGLSCQNTDRSQNDFYNRNIQQASKHGQETKVNESDYTTGTPSAEDALNPMSVYIYVGIGVGMLVLFAIQTSCLIWYFKRARYYKRPTGSVIKKVEPNENVYESLAEVQKAPTPPPINSIPRTPRTHNKLPPLPIKSPGSPNSIRSQKSTQSSNSTTCNVKDIRTPNLIRHREQMPLPHEIPKPDISLSKIPSTRHRPKLSSPTDTVPMVTTLPSKIYNKPKISVNKSNTYNSSLDTIVSTELLEKLKKRAEKNASFSESSTLTNHSSPLGSRKPVEIRPRLQGRHQREREPRAPLQISSRQVQYTGGYDNRESSSDNEWTMEQLEPYHIYNI